MQYALHLWKAFLIGQSALRISAVEGIATVPCIYERHTPK